MNDKHRCSRVLRWWGAVLLCLAALPPATASRSSVGPRPSAIWNRSHQPRVCRGRSAPITIVA